ncbi:MAG TPA: ABC transporter permease subunit [Mycobacteriales bacterium]|nr:ABC transporter permease subunit [Mycobacteriales bacterium]
MRKSFGVIRSDLRLRRTSLVMWTVAVAALVAGIAAIYPTVRANPSLDRVYGGMSPTLQALLGGSSLTSPAGYLRTQLFAFFLPAVLLVFAIGRGAGSVAGEEEDRTLDLLLSQPVARTRLYIEKAFAVVIGVSALTFACTVAVVALRDPSDLTLPYGNLIATCVQMGLLCTALGLGAQAIAAATGHRAVGIAASAGYTFVSYVVYGLSATVHPLYYARPLTLWRWYLAGDPLTSGFDGIGLGVLGAVSFVLMAAGGAAFRRRDLHA